MSADEAVSRHFYANLGADGLRRRSRPDWDAAVVDLAAGYLAGRERILNLGCGYGRIAIPLTARGYRVIGLDHVPSPGSALGAPASTGAPTPDGNRGATARPALSRFPRAG